MPNNMSQVLAEELHRAEQYESTHIIEEDGEQTEDTTEHNQEEWMFLCQLQPTYHTTDSPEDNNVNWEEAASQLPPPVLLSCPNWIKQMKAQSDSSTTCTSRLQLPPVDINSLNEQQLYMPTDLYVLTTLTMTNHHFTC